MTRAGTPPYMLIGAGGLVAILMAANCAPAAGPSTSDSSPIAPKIEDLPLKDSVTRHRITWTFERKVRVGRFVNGDWYVVGPVTVTAIAPKSENGRNCSVLNLPVSSRGASPFDDRVRQGRGEKGKKLRAHLPVSMKPGDALISSISVEEINKLTPWLQESPSPVGTVSVLTCLTEPVPPDAFRPSYCDRGQKICLARNLKWELLPKLKPVSSTPKIAEVAKHFERPWLDICYFGSDAAAEYQPRYAREVGRAAGISTLMLLLDFTREQKRPLLIGVVQRGIDLWGIARAGYTGWPAIGGHGSGRKLPIVFAGIMLGDKEMATPNKTLPKLQFGEDMQTMYGQSWTGAKVVFAGHSGSKAGALGPYEHLHPAKWTKDNITSENYRRCCTSLAWVGQALALRILHAEKYWDHPAFFDYVDRWMHEDDGEHVKVIKEAPGNDYTANWARQGQCWDKFVEEMWAEHRKTLKPPADGWKAKD